MIMRRSTATKRTIAIPPVRGVQAQINVTPLVDVVLVLLIIFMVMTPLVEKNLAVHLSTEKQKEPTAETMKQQIVVSLDGAGTLRINSQPTARADYVARLRNLLSDQGRGEQVVFVRADDHASFRALVASIDGAKQAGATTVGFATDVSP